MDVQWHVHPLDSVFSSASMVIISCGVLRCWQALDLRSWELPSWLVCLWHLMPKQHLGSLLKDSGAAPEFHTLSRAGGGSDGRSCLITTIWLQTIWCDLYIFILLLTILFDNHNPVVREGFNQWFHPCCDGDWGIWRRIIPLPRALWRTISFWSPLCDF